MTLTSSQEKKNTARKKGDKPKKKKKFETIKKDTRTLGGKGESRGICGTEREEPFYTREVSPGAGENSIPRKGMLLQARAKKIQVGRKRGEKLSPKKKADSLGCCDEEECSKKGYPTNGEESCNFPRKKKKVEGGKKGPSGALA